MGNREEFEKWAESKGIDLTPMGDYYASDRTQEKWWMWQQRQPELDAKDKIIDYQALQKGILKAEVGRLSEENAALKSEVERLRKDAERYQALPGLN